MKKVWLLGLALVLTSACSGVRTVRPLSPGQNQLSLSLGGPLFDTLGIPLPVPMLSLDYQYGWTEHWTVGGALHLTPLVFGILGMAELNTLYGASTPQGGLPGVSLYGNVILFTDLVTGLTILPDLGILAYWEIAGRLRPYTGVSAMLNFYPRTAGLPKETWILPSFIIGAEWLLGYWDISLECRLIHPSGNTEGKAVHFVGLGGYGAWAPYLSVSYRFGGEK